MDTTNSGGKEYQFPLLGLATKVNLHEPCFSPNGEHLAFVISTEGMNSIYVVDFKNGIHPSNFRKINVGEESKPSALYGGGHYCWNSSSDLILIANKQGLWRIRLADGKEERLSPASFNASAPVVFEQRAYFTSMLENTMVLASIRLGTASLPLQESEFHNFIIDPVCSPFGDFIAWHEWDFPYMPWDESRITIKTLRSRSNSYKKNELFTLAKIRTSFSQPCWHPKENSMVFLSDQTRWLNLWFLEEVGETPRILFEDHSEHGYPSWLARRKTLAWSHDGKKIFHVRNTQGEVRLAYYDFSNEEDVVLGLPPGYYEGLTIHPKKPIISFVFSSPFIPPTLFAYHYENGVVESLISSHSRFGISEGLLSVHHFKFPTTDKQEAYGILYRSANANIEKAPIIVNAHGGPTSQRLKSWNPNANFFSTRGYIYIELNYRGSTGYGRNYAQSLNGYWGKRDTEDAVHLLSYLSRKGIGDTERATIMGGSAGGFLVLNVMTKYPETYSAGIARAPVTDLFHLARHTHYFESHYNHMLVGKLPEDAEKYREYSPIFHAEELKRPLMIIQGEKDQVVPKTQVEEFVQKSRKNGVPVSYVTYANEGHGIERKANLLDMYNRIIEFIEKHVL